MMNGIFGGLAALSLLCALCTGRMEALSSAVLEGAGNAVQLILQIVGIMCLWCGLMKVAQRSGLAHHLAQGMLPLARRLLPGVPASSPAFSYLAMNIAVNLLGVSSGATPLGLKAMEELQKHNPQPHRATNAMCTMVVLNTASIQLVPSTLLALRMQEGSQDPFCIMLPIWGTSLLAAIVGLSVAKLLEKVM
ncbi:MAG: nucleoside recognition domain-containing protein [Eubacteriales bacterium]|jgi:spore maturation protein A